MIPYRNQVGKNTKPYRTAFSALRRTMSRLLKIKKLFNTARPTTIYRSSGQSPIMMILRSCTNILNRTSSLPSLYEEATIGEKRATYLSSEAYLMENNPIYCRAYSRLSETIRDEKLKNISKKYCAKGRS